MICEAICDRGGSIIECSKITITKFDENSFSSKYKPGSSIQGASEGTKEERRKIHES